MSVYYVSDNNQRKDAVSRITDMKQIEAIQKCGFYGITPDYGNYCLYMNQSDKGFIVLPPDSPALQGKDEIHPMELPIQERKKWIAALEKEKCLVLENNDTVQVRNGIVYVNNTAMTWDSFEYTYLDGRQIEEDKEDEYDR